ncbi:hypothetical protein [Salipaludibacillus aurantiacus]|uniref:Uncharacterized protein n=1 Tax=Salipaludibacillus aurantiacus TaxID=1601833 RepID=A0A1H9VAU1_9BACI|nr:hypothetical protein [Salipaludibacillus aurantiacus]SES18651.1 hypothetical protein SAMN05518684_11035 [Salipaludibacillus aurantiacus]
MGLVFGACAVTVEITAVDGQDLPQPVVAFEAQLIRFGEEDITVSVFGTPVTFPCPATDFTATVDSPFGSAALRINAEQLQ